MFERFRIGTRLRVAVGLMSALVAPLALSGALGSVADRLAASARRARPR